MTDWRPSSDPAAASRRAELLQRARHYFAGQDILAIDTPALSRSAGTDPNVDNLTVRPNAGNVYFLHTSPEFCMKRLLADGYPDIYSICRVFRDGESGRRHIPEFTMAEWYRLGFDLPAIIEDTLQFIAACLDEPALIDSVIQFDYAEAFQGFANVDVYEASADELVLGYSDDARLKSIMGEDRQALLDLILGTVIAPQFARNQLTVVRHYPAAQASLARLCPGDKRVADRFEVFCGDLELANGYVELTDAEEQRQRFHQDLELRQQTGRPLRPQDHRLLAALESGLPDCAGVAVGIERLQMVLDKTDDISDVVTFTPETS